MLFGQHYVINISFIWMVVHMFFYFESECTFGVMERVESACVIPSQLQFIVFWNGYKSH